MSTNACEDADCGCKSALTFMQSWKDPFRYLRLIVYINICVWGCACVWGLCGTCGIWYVQNTPLKYFKQLVDDIYTHI